MRIALHGASGRMGRAIAQVIAAENDLSLVAAFAAPGDPELGRDVGELAGVRALGVPIELVRELGDVDAVIDFSAPSATAELARRCLKQRVPLVSGTTGLDEVAERALDELAAVAPVVHAPNMSVGVNVLFYLAEVAARLAHGFDPEIVEMHHRKKVDAPSGTALRLAERVAAARSLDPKRAIVAARSGAIGARREDEIGVMTLRGGSVVGEHTLILAGAGERLELVHRAEDRSIFARGAVRAARWIVGKPPGRYDMPDVLGIVTAY
jgi:4-hydroxy-tetrahydrodipicolinate reductase